MQSFRLLHRNQPLECFLVSCGPFSFEVDFWGTSVLIFPLDANQSSHLCSILEKISWETQNWARPLRNLNWFRMYFGLGCCLRIPIKKDYLDFHQWKGSRRWKNGSKQKVYLKFILREVERSTWAIELDVDPYPDRFKIHIKRISQEVLEKIQPTPPHDVIFGKSLTNLNFCAHD